MKLVIAPWCSDLANPNLEYEVYVADGEFAKEVARWKYDHGKVWPRPRFYPSECRAVRVATITFRMDGMAHVDADWGPIADILRAVRLVRRRWMAQKRLKVGREK